MKDWVAVTERLPELLEPDFVCVTTDDPSPLSSARVLVFDEDEGEQFIAEWLQPVDGDESFWSDVSSGCTLRGVTHWRILPDDPQIPLAREAA